MSIRGRISRRSLVLRVLMIAVIGTGLGFLALSRDGVPEIDVEEHQLEISSPTGNPTARQLVDVHVKNIGTGTLSISDVETSCGCTVVKGILQHDIAPGEISTIQVEATPPHFGERVTRIVIHSNAKSTPRLPVGLTLRGKKLDVPYVSEWPSEIQLKGAQAGVNAESTLVLTTVEAADTDPWIDGIQLDAGIGTCQILEVTSKTGPSLQSLSRSYRVVLRIPTPELSVNRVRQRLVPSFRALPPDSIPSVNIVCEIEPPVRVSPQELLITLSPSASLAEKVLIVVFDDVQTAGIQVVDPSVAWLSVDSPQRVKDGETGMFSVKVRANRSNLEDTTLTTSLVILTQHSDVPRLEVPITLLQQ